MLPDDEIHQHYANLLQDAGIVLYGRKTFELMKYWQTVLKNPTENKAEDDFARIIDMVPKLVFSRKLNNTAWHSALLAKKSLKDEVSELKDKPGKDIFIGSPGLIVQLTNLNLIDEYQLCIHPVIAGKGLPLFKDMNHSFTLKLLKNKTFTGGAEILYYTRGKK